VDAARRGKKTLPERSILITSTMATAALYRGVSTQLPTSAAPPARDTPAAAERRAVKAAVAIVERDEDRALRQRLLSAARRVHVVERDGRPAIRAQPLEEADQPIDGDRVVVEIALEIDDIVKRDAGKSILPRAPERARGR